MRLKDFIDVNPVILAECVPVAFLVALYQYGFKKIMLVMNKEGQVKGIVAPYSLRCGSDGCAVLEKPVKEIMTADFVICKEPDVDKFQGACGENLIVFNSNEELIGVIEFDNLPGTFYGCLDFNGQKDYYESLILVNAERQVIGYNLAVKKSLSLGEKERLMQRPIEEIIPKLKFDHTEKQIKMELKDKLLSTSIYPLAINQKGIGWIIVINNISQINWIVQELNTLKELNRELEVIIDSSYDELYVVDAEGKTLRVNSSACKRLYGLEAKDLIGKNVKELEKEGLFFPSVASIVKEKKQRITTIQETRSGKKLIITANPVFNEKNELVKIVTNSRDVTELNLLQKKLEETQELNRRYFTELKELRKKIVSTDDIVVCSNEMKKIFDLVGKIADVDSTVLILGESGVGKDIVAKKIHQLGRRSGGPFIKINCGAIPENLLEAELFGYEPGAFTGARKEGKIGLLELADKGILFLDEIADLPYLLQVKLLQVIQDRSFMRVGGTRIIDVDVRIIAATNKNLEDMVNKGKFREDLYYRLNVIPIEIPPLRERREEIAPLVFYFLEKFEKNYGIKKKISPKVMEALMNYFWPGNIRELENTIERLVVTVDGEEILLEHIPEKIKETKHFEHENKIVLKHIAPLREVVDEIERKLIVKAYKELGSTAKVAKALGVHETTVLRKAKALNIKITK